MLRQRRRGKLHLQWYVPGVIWQLEDVQQYCRLGCAVTITWVDTVYGVKHVKVQVFHGRPAVGCLKANSESIWLVQHIVQDAVAGGGVGIHCLGNSSPALQKMACPLH